MVPWGTPFKVLRVLLTGDGDPTLHQIDPVTTETADLSSTCPYIRQPKQIVNYVCKGNNRNSTSGFYDREINQT